MDVLALYRRSEASAACVEIVTYAGYAVVVAIARRADHGSRNVVLVRDSTLTHERLRDALDDCRVLVTFSGYGADVSALLTEFADAMPACMVALDISEIIARRELLAGTRDMLAAQFELATETRPRRDITTRLWELASESDLAMKELVRDAAENAATLREIVHALAHQKN